MVLIKNGRVFDGESFSYNDILIEGGTVSRIEPSISEHADFIYDAKGKTVAPGLVDIHVHMRGISSKKYGIQAEMSCFPFGVTSAADAGGGNGNKELIDSFMLKSVVFVGVSFRNNRLDVKRTEELLDLYGDKAVGLKVYFDEELSELKNISPLHEVMKYAREKSLPVLVHCSNSPTPMGEIVDALGEGDILTHSFHGGKNNASVDGFRCLKRAKSRGITVDAGFAGHVHTDFKVFRSAVEAGVTPDTVSTDITKYSAFTRGGRYGMTMCMSIARAAGMTEEEIFRAVTSAPSARLGKENEWGYLRVGRSADIAVLDYTDRGFDLTDKAGNRLQSKNGYRCLLTLSDGQVVYKD